MCHKVDLGNGHVAIICGMRRRTKYCACGRPEEFQCDWKVKTRRSGTCDASICRQHALQVGPDKHLCPEHQKAWESWQRAHPGFVTQPDYPQMALVLDK